LPRSMPSGTSSATGSIQPRPNRRKLGVAVESPCDRRGSMRATRLAIQAPAR
jgi:hypothetical protein